MRPTSICTWFPLLTIAACFPVQELAAQNSTKKIRAKPSELASRAGSAVKWRKDLETARAESAQSGKPLFWYVPSVARSPMDRKPEIDRYMMAGPFSWPSTIALLNEHFVPVKHVATRDEQKEFALAPRDFIEPGYLVFDSKGEETLRLDQITTFERVWFETPLAEAVGQSVDTDGVWAWMPRDARRDVEPGIAAQPQDDGKSFENRPAWAQRAFVEGVAQWNAGDRDVARATWKRITETAPEAPIAAKAAAELEGHGPYTMGFEVLRQLPAAACKPSGDGSRVAPGVYTEDELWNRGVEFILRMRTPEGGIEDSKYDFGGTDSLPNVYVACTALCGWAVLEHAAAHDADRIAEAWPFFEYVADESKLNFDDRDEIAWAQMYRTRFYCRLLDLWKDDTQKKQVRTALERSVDALTKLQREGGAWHHEYPNPFVTASALVALRDAERHGVTISRKFVDRGLKALLSCRNDEGAYSYGMPRRGKVRASTPASIGRMALGELALSGWGIGKQEWLQRSLDASFEHHAKLAGVRKYDDHSNRWGHGGFFFWYDMRARSEAIMQIEDPQARAKSIAAQRELILALPEIDGCFVDSHELGRCYGTAMALLSLRVMQN